MADLACPICNADLLLTGDEVAGEEVFCPYCTAPLRLTQNVEGDECDVEEDF